MQIGDPYTQKKMHDFLLEARDAGLVPYLTDNGGGGLSSSVGESARLSPGAVVDLKKVPLKYEGLDPWQIWVSESQERMTVAVEPDDEAAFMALADKHQVEATVIGRFTGDGKLRLTTASEVCCYVDVEFLEEGFPQWEFEALWTPPEARGLSEPVISPPQDLGGLVLDLLDSPNLCSREWINRQYDHEVQGTSLLKPFCGRDQDAPAEASVILPVLDQPGGPGHGPGTSPRSTATIDTKAMVQASGGGGLSPSGGGGRRPGAGGRGGQLLLALHPVSSGEQPGRPLQGGPTGAGLLGAQGSLRGPGDTAALGQGLHVRGRHPLRRRHGSCPSG